MTKTLLKNIFISVFVLCLTAPVNAEVVDDLNINKYVNDFANLLSDTKEAELEKLLGDNYASTTNQLVVVTVNNISGDYIENYSIKLAEKIKAGSAQNDNGVIFLIAKDDRKVRIEVGYGLEDKLTDLKTSRIINEVVTPAFKSGDYESGVMGGVRDILRVTSGAEYAGENGDNKNIIKQSSIEQWTVSVIMILFFVFPWLAAILGRTKAWWLGGVIGFVVAALLFLFLLKTLLVFLLVVFGLLFDYVVSKNYKESVINQKDPDWWAGGSWGPGSSSGWRSSSGGGFSGGGGSFGGGGSSGSW
jgi:uncharacterized protein